MAQEAYVTRTHRRTAVAMLVAALALGLAACGDGDSADPTAATPTASAAGDESPSETATPAPTVSPATGLKLSEETSVMRVPEGWVRTEPLVNFASGADGPGRDEWIQLADRVSLAGDTTLNSLAHTHMRTLPKGAKGKRLPNVDLDGTPAYEIRYPDPDFPAVIYDIVALRNGRSIAINISLGKKTRRRHPQLLKSMLSTFRWKD
jgi:hypothetical protein